ncbi:MAG: VOC family protein [Thermoleophilaceae bacterium]
MPERNEYAPGTPSWVDLAAPDLDVAKSFYGGLFGWDTEEAGPQDEVGDYAFFLLNGKRVCAFGSPSEGEPPSWRTYVAVADVDETADKVKDAGGEILFGPADIMDAGRMVTFKDTEGAIVGAWQPGEHQGAQLVNEPGAISWNELATGDPDAAKSFYTEVFGWETEDRDLGEIPYITLKVDDRPVGGMLPLTDKAPEGTSPHWLPYFAVEDFDAAIEKAGELDGEVVAPKADTPAGPFAVLKDPSGAAFAVIDPSQAAQESAEADQSEEEDEAKESDEAEESEEKEESSE